VINKLTKNTKTDCIHDNKIYQFNTTWSPFSCTLCHCNFNSVVDCFVKDCPSLLNCQVIIIIIIIFILNELFKLLLKIYVLYL
jgi:hypothetical protein